MSNVENFIKRLKKEFPFLEDDVPIVESPELQKIVIIYDIKERGLRNTRELLQWQELRNKYKGKHTGKRLTITIPRKVVNYGTKEIKEIPRSREGRESITRGEIHDNRLTFEEEKEEKLKLYKNCSPDNFCAKNVNPYNMPCVKALDDKTRKVFVIENKNDRELYCNTIQNTVTSIGYTFMNE